MRTGAGSAPAVATAQARPALGPHGGYQGPVRCPGTAVTRVVSSGPSTGDTASGDTVSNFILLFNRVSNLESNLVSNHVSKNLVSNFVSNLISFDLILSIFI